MYQKPAQPGASHSTAPRPTADLLIALALFAGSLVYFSLTLNRTIELRDEGEILYHSARAAAGAVPHRDFVDVYGPGVFALTGLVLRLFDNSILPVRILLALLKAASVVLTFYISRCAVTRPFAFLGALLGLAYWGRWSWNLNTPYAALFTIPLCMLATLLLIRALHRPSGVSYFAAGLAGGAAILFKQSLGVLHAGGMILAVCGVALLEADPSPRPSRLRVLLCLSCWLVAAIAPVVLVAGFVTRGDYVLHFLPLHLLFLLLAIATCRRLNMGTVTTTVRTRFGPLAAGLAVLPVLTGVLYASLGSLRQLLVDMFVLPGRLTNYYLPAPLPPPGLVILLIAAVALVSSGLLFLGRRRGVGVAVGACALVLLALGHSYFRFDTVQRVQGGDGRVLRDLYKPGVLWLASDFLEGVEPMAILLVGVAMLAASLFRAPRPAALESARTMLPLIVFQGMMGFQIFPRASYNIWLLQGALAPVLAVAVYRWSRVGASMGASVPRRAVATGLAALVPLWLIGPVVQRTVAPPPIFARPRPLRLPAMDGIALSEFETRWQPLGDVEQLVRFLRTAEPPTAPVLLLTNDFLVLFLAGREHLLQEGDYYLFLLGWGMLPSMYLPQVSTHTLVKRLTEVPSALIVDRPDECGVRIYNSLPELTRFIAERYEVSTRIGAYRVLRQKL